MCGVASRFCPPIILRRSFSSESLLLLANFALQCFKLILQGLAFQSCVNNSCSQLFWPTCGEVGLMMSLIFSALLSSIYSKHLSMSHMICPLGRIFHNYTRKNAQVATELQTSCSKSVHKLLTKCIRTACSEFVRTSLEQAVDKL